MSNGVRNVNLNINSHFGSSNSIMLDAEAQAKQRRFNNYSHLVINKTEHD